MFYKAGVDGGRKGLRMEGRGPALLDVARRPPFGGRKIRVHRETDNSIFAAKTRRNHFVVCMVCHVYVAVPEQRRRNDMQSVVRINICTIINM